MYSYITQKTYVTGEFLLESISKDDKLIEVD